MLGKFFSALVILGLFIGGFVVSWPSLFGLQRTEFIAHLVAIRPLIIAGGIVLVVITIILSIFVKQIRAFAASLTLVVLIIGGINLAVLATRGWQPDELDVVQQSEANPATADKEIVVLSWNTLGDKPGVDTIVQLALDEHADVIVLPETTGATTAQIAAKLGQSGMKMQVLHRSNNPNFAAQSTGLLISTKLGAYQLSTDQGDTSVLPTLVAKSESGPTIVAVHAVAPVGQAFLGWQQDLRWLSSLCQSSDVIMAGDFNATLDHLVGLQFRNKDLGNCQDAAKTRSAAALGTWPNWLPTQLGVPIDHVFFGAGWQVEHYDIIEKFDDAGSDHRPVVAHLSPQNSIN